MGCGQGSSLHIKDEALTPWTLAPGVMGSVLEDAAQAVATMIHSEDILLFGLLLSLGRSQGESLSLVLVCL